MGQEETGVPSRVCVRRRPGPSISVCQQMSRKSGISSRASLFSTEKGDHYSPLGRVSNKGRRSHPPRARPALRALLTTPWARAFTSSVQVTDGRLARARGRARFRTSCLLTLTRGPPRPGRQAVLHYHPALQTPHLHLDAGSLPAWLEVADVGTRTMFLPNAPKSWSGVRHGAPRQRPPPPCQPTGPEPPPWPPAPAVCPGLAWRRSSLTPDPSAP